MKSRIRQFLIKVRTMLYRCVWYPYVLILKRKYGDDCIQIESYIKGAPGLRFHRNWGDDINIHMFEYVTKKKFVSIPYTRMRITPGVDCYSMIGSTLAFYNLNGKIIYGTGIMDPNSRIVGRPKRVISVRGPLTRDIMLKHGIECPMVYGDPALLLPLFYQPQRVKGKKVTIIPNMGTSKKEIKRIISRFKNEEVQVIDMKHYNDWHEIIDRVCDSCCVLSESLHGLIVADAYGIPNVWVEFKKHPSYWDFKFHDYYQSIGIDTAKSLKVYNNAIRGSQMDDIMNKTILTWKKRNINFDNLLSSFPFDIECQVIPQ